MIADAARRLGRVDAVWFLVALTIGAQIAYPLTHGDGRTALTIASVVTFFLASVAHAAATRGPRAAVALVAVCCGIGLAAESIGTRTGFPFGAYTYSTTLGPKLLHVPLVIPPAWAMMAWPALLAGRRARRPVLLGAAVLVSWDLFLDPQMVDAGHWVWAPSAWPTLHAIPLSNSLGWAGVALVMLSVLHRAVGDGATRGRANGDAPAFVLLVWTWFSETFGHLVFFGRPGVALVGGVAMGAVLLAMEAPVLRESAR